VGGVDGGLVAGQDAGFGEDVDVWPKVGTHRVTASYVPGADSLFLASTSLERIHTVKRCFCDAEHGH
jgi:hypothetical protein